MNVTMVFGIIATVIVMSMLFVFAVPQFSNLFGLGGQAQLQKTVQDIETMTDDIYVLAKGSSRLATINLASGTKVCFINPNDPSERVWGRNEPWKWWNPDRMVIESLLSDPASEYYGYNIWIYTPQTEIGEGYKIEHLRPQPQYEGDSGNFCIDSGRQLYFENKGTYVEVSTA